MATFLPAFVSAGSAYGRSGAHAAAITRPHAPSGAGECGIASWHEVTPAPAGGLTASSRRWHNSDLVAAHRTLPLGTLVRVINLRNQKTVVVEIADRGPYARGRVIDLSVAAAIRLGMITAGTASVRLEVVHADPAAAAPPLSLARLVALLFAPLPGWSFPIPAA